jgi:hypothetical protein
MRRGHPLGSVAATLALSDWERRTAVGADGEDWDDESEPEKYESKEKP